MKQKRVMGAIVASIVSSPFSYTHSMAELSDILIHAMETNYSPIKLIYIWLWCEWCDWRDSCAVGTQNHRTRNIEVVHFHFRVNA